MELQRGVQADGVAVCHEAGVQPLEPDPRASLGRPEGPAGRVPHPGTHLADPFLDRVGRPVPDGQHAAALGRRPLLGLAVADQQGAVLTELPALRIASKVGEIQHSSLVASQAVGVRDLEQGGIPEGRQPALAALAANTQDLLVCMIEECLQLRLGEGPSFWLTLGFVGVRRGIPVVDHLDWMSTEVPQALVAPAIGWVGQEVAELPHRALIVAQGRADAAVHSPEIGRPFVDVLRRPLPRHRIGMPDERPDRTFLVIDVSQ